MDFLGSLLNAGSNLLGGIMSSNAAEDIADKNIANQIQFATQGLTWKARDARTAEQQYGINPLALLGTSTNSYSNVVGGDGGGSGVAGMGQGLERAANALSAQNDKSKQLQDDLVRAQIAKTNSETVANQAAASTSVMRSQQAVPGVRNQTVPLYQTAKDPDGNTVMIPSDKVSSGLQTIAAWPTNIAVGADLALRNMGIRHPFDSFKSWLDSHGNSGVRGDVWRDGMPVYMPGG